LQALAGETLCNSASSTARVMNLTSMSVVLSQEW
jgi:hypothetical protein